MGRPPQKRSENQPAPVTGARWIALTQDRWTLVDDRDYTFLISFGTWSFNPVKMKRDPKAGYAVTGKSAGGKRNIYMHKLLTGYEEVDHKDGNKLNNRRGNLRDCTHSQNQSNRPLPCSNRSGFRGVSWFRRDSCWRAFIKVNGKQKHLGYFQDRVLAAKKYDQAARKLFGEFARLNFPEGVE